MEKQTIMAWGVILVVLGGLVWWSSTRTSTGSTSSTMDGFLSATETFYDFGTISMKDGNVERVFTVTNPTDREVMLKMLVTSCMCTTAFLISLDGSKKGPFGMPGMGFVPPVNEVIGPGESRGIRVVYDPNAHGPSGVGPIDRFIYLKDASGRTLELEIKAVVTP